MIQTPKLFVLVGIRQECQKTRAFYGNSQLALVECLRSCNAGRNDFTVFRDKVFQQINLFVIDFLDFFSRETAEFSTFE
ncbi:hypothetical protein NEILACOT_04757 [Neisseria lactamica ATCC 23970]|uniref:Uncharacterized protein n=1 Tax=Neisseria lactamica ATCC 23970 TaxID=546265 RepID=D0WB34_NEILA|nr:hypothetical protein NEILACOT_04757 [Neisseria lactamica ATCC 23970]